MKYMEARPIQKTYVADIDRKVFDEKNEFRYSYKTNRGLTPDIVMEISEQKDEPKWMRDFRLKSLEIYNQLDVPPWGPDLTDLDVENIVTYVKPPTDLQYSWDDIPEDIKNTFTKLGIPKAEHEFLAGVGAQYDSEVVYHSIQKNFAKKGVVYLDMETAIKEYEDIVR